MQRVLGLLWRLNALLAALIAVAAAAMCLIMVSCIVLQVVSRVATGGSPPWTEEIALLMFGWIVLLMIAIGVRENAHVRVAALIGCLPERAGNAAERMIRVLIGAVAIYLFWAGSGYLVDMSGSTSAAIRYPIELLYAAMPVSAAIMALFALESAIRGVPGRAVPRRVLPTSNEH